FLVAWRRRYEIPQQDLPWLLGVARNLILHHRRDAGRAGAPVDLDDASLLTAHLDEAVSERQRVLGSLKDLSESDRELLLLTAWDGLSPSEVAAVLGLSAATVRVRLHRARRRFAHALSLAD